MRISTSVLNMRRRLLQILVRLPRNLLNGYYFLPKQKNLLQEIDWNVLIILDAARADRACRHLHGAFPVRSLAHLTLGWIEKFLDFARRQEILYVTGNPVVNRELSSVAHNFSIISPWQDRWKRFGPLNIPTVPPSEVRNATFEYVAESGQPSRMVVHFLQPHSPYVGDYSLPFTEWPNMKAHGLSDSVRRMPSVRSALAQGKLSLEQVERAYESNLSLVVPYAKEVAECLKGTVVITADHGELLGEDGYYGHRQYHPFLRVVPWQVRDNGAFEPKPIQWDDTTARKDNSVIEQRLRGLGYL